MFEIPSDILSFFFDEINKMGKYEIIISGNSAIIKPRKEQEYYKPDIYVKDLDELRETLIHFVESLNEFYSVNNNLESYHDLSYFFNNLFFNMTSSDASDLAKYIDKRSYFFSNRQFEEFCDQTVLVELDNVKFYVQRLLESPGLETPFILVFTMEVNGIMYQLPLVRYAFDENNTCHLFALQYGRNREGAFSDEDYKSVVNQVNTGISRYRNVSPSFVLTFALFLKLLSDYNFNKIVVPDFLFGRYRKYYKANSEIRSDRILTRILDNFIRLFQRLEVQVEGFEITYLPNEIDSFTHIELGDMDSKNQLLNRILKKTNCYFISPL